MTLLEVRVSAKELDMLAAVFQSAAILDDFLEAHASPAGGSNRAFAPRRVDELVTVTRILADLLNAPGTGALKSNRLGYAGKD